MSRLLSLDPGQRPDASRPHSRLGPLPMSVPVFLTLPKGFNWGVSAWSGNICASLARPSHLGAGQVDSGARIWDPSVVPGVPSPGQHGWGSALASGFPGIALCTAGKGRGYDGCLWPLFQCANPLLELTAQEDCCGSVGAFWGVTSCAPCPPRPGECQAPGHRVWGEAFPRPGLRFLSHQGLRGQAGRTGW